MKSFCFRFFSALAWAGFILLASSIPEPLEVTSSETASFLLGFEILGVGGVTLVSFVIHFSLYAVLGFLVGRGMLQSGCNPRSNSGAGQGSSAVPRHQGMSGQSSPTFFFLALALCMAFGFLDELYQELIPGRGFEWIDILANSLGAAVGLLIFAKLSGCKKTGDRSRGAE